MRRMIPFLLLSLSLFPLAAAETNDPQPRQLRLDRGLGRAVIVEPAQPLTDADRADLAGQGLRIGRAIGGGRYLARLTGATVADARVAAVEPLTREHKLLPSALQAAGRGKTWQRVVITFHDDVDIEEARTAILDAGGAIDDPFRVRFSALRRISATVAPASLDALAADDRVLSVAGRRNWRVAADNSRSAELSHVTELHSAPYDLTGAGVVVSLFELGAAQASHPEFQGRLTLHESVVGGASGDRLHATHVAGTIAAAGINAEAKGMAPNAHVHQFCVSSPSNDCTGYWLDHKEDDLTPLGVRVDNNSWGYILDWTEEGGFPVYLASDVYLGAYDLQVTAPLDDISNEQGILFIHSAGNSGNLQSFPGDFSEHRHVDNKGDTIKTELFCYSKNGSGTDCPASCSGTSSVTNEAKCETSKHLAATPFDTMGVTAAAKNVISVGAVTTGTPLPIAGFSSRGPAKDGRVKPDVVARGTGVLSTVPTDAYARNQGTSMASPAVAGIAALLVEQWRKLFNGANPTPAQLKALIIAGTEDVGNPGPDYTFGFGLVNAKASVDLIRADGGRGDRVRTTAIGQGQTYEAVVVVSEPQSFRAVLNWPDPAIPFSGGSDIAEKALVNDLDLRVIDPSGAEHRPWTLNRELFKDNATRGVNTVDNVEMVDITNAPAGAYRVLVTGTRVTQGPQTAVLVTSARAAAPCRDATEALGANDTAATAHGNIAAGQTISGAICTAADVDYYKFVATKNGPVSVVMTAGDTPIRATLNATGLDATVDVPANSSRTLTANATSAPLPITLRVEAAGALGVEPQYSFVASYGIAHQQRRRVVR
jgi:hypothetical protein